MLWWSQIKQSFTKGIPHPKISQSLRSIILFPRLERFIQWSIGYPISDLSIEKSIHDFYLPYQFDNSVSDLLQNFLMTLSRVSLDEIPVTFLQIFRKYSHLVAENGYLLRYLTDPTVIDGNISKILKELFLYHEYKYLPSSMDTETIMSTIQHNKSNLDLLLLIFYWIYQTNNLQIMANLRENEFNHLEVIQHFRSPIIQEWFKKHLHISLANNSFLDIQNIGNFEIIPYDNPIIEMNIRFYDNIKEGMIGSSPRMKRKLYKSGDTIPVKRLKFD